MSVNMGFRFIGHNSFFVLLKLISVNLYIEAIIKKMGWKGKLLVTLMVVWFMFLMLSLVTFRNPQVVYNEEVVNVRTFNRTLTQFWLRADVLAEEVLSWCNGVSSFVVRPETAWQKVLQQAYWEGVVDCSQNNYLEKVFFTTVNLSVNLVAAVFYTLFGISCLAFVLLLIVCCCKFYRRCPPKREERDEQIALSSEINF